MEEAQAKCYLPRGRSSWSLEDLSYRTYHARRHKRTFKVSLCSCNRSYLIDIYHSQKPVTTTSAPLPLSSTDNSPQDLINRPAKAGVMSSAELQAQMARVKSEQQERILQMKAGMHKIACSKFLQHEHKRY